MNPFKLRNKIKSGLLGMVLTFLFGMMSIYVIAQESSITGLVTDNSTHEPIPGVNIVIKGTTNGCTSDIDGKFSINASKYATLVFSFIGYESQEVSIGGQKTINVQLQLSEESLKEVVVIGYGQTTKKEITGSISSIKTDDFNQGTYTDAIGLIQGKVAGLTISNTDGADPDGSYKIILRGTNTLVAGMGPLIIIDGVAGADLKTINFEEVESIDVLKDGSAAAIYGTRGTNGVIIITTKRAKVGKTSVEFSSQLSVQVNPISVRTLTADEFTYAIKTYAPDKIGSIYGASTDWFSQVTRKNPLSQKYSLAITGGTETFSHRTTFNIEKNEGILLNNESDKYILKTNIKQKAFENHLELNYNASLSMRQYTPANYDVFYQAFIQNPTQPVYDPTNTAAGGYSSLPGIDYYNPVAMLNERQRVGHTIDLSQNINAKLKLFEGLDWTNFIAYEKSTTDESSYETKYYPEEIGKDGVAEIDNSGSYNLQYESTVNYSKTIKKHNIQAVAGYSYQEFGDNSNYMLNSGFDTDLYGTNNIGAGSSLQAGTGEMSSYKESSKLIAFFGRVMYNFNEKYLASVSLRREGSSKFGTNDKWGNFPAASFGWRINKEDFMKSVSFVNDLKLRLGYGVTGNQDFANYQSLIMMGKAGKFFYNGEWINTYQPVSNPNPDLRWEKKSEYDLGVDFSIWHSRVSGTIDAYYRETTDLLYTYNVSVPPYIYYELFTNVGTISNKGIEISLNIIPVKTSDFQWNTLFTFSKNVNKLVKFSNSEFTNKYLDVGWINTIALNSQRIQEGQPLGNFFGPVWTGVGANGNDQFRNANPVGLVSPDKWQVMGNAYPLFTLGWSNTFKYKNWNLNMTFRSNVGGNVLDSYRLYYENWQKIGTQNIVYSQLQNPNFTGVTTYSSKYIEDATFLKLDNVSLSYDVKYKIKYISAARLSLTAQNVFCLTKYKGLDPEVDLTGLTPGIENLSYYPKTTTISFGINITF